jgi:hypothetical protein
MGSMSNTNRCKVCGVRKAGHTDYCRLHKFAIRRSLRRVVAESLIIDLAGGAWWVWDARGGVLVIGESTREHALAALDLGAEATDEAAL